MPDRLYRYKGARRSVQMGLNMSMNLEQAREKLEHYGQQHLLRYYEELSEEQKDPDRRTTSIRLLTRHSKIYNSLVRPTLYGASGLRAAAGH